MIASSADYVKSTNSGNSFRTVVLRAPANAAPRWTARKCEMNRKKFNRSAMTVNPAL
jgi:hypothetical protein